MADIRCTHCGKDNPDFLDVCQFCQSPLKSESMLHIGQKPTKKNTGELEGVLPDWLKNARQQARDSAEEDAANAASQPKPKKDEPVDLLAGLFQSDSSEEEDVPDWLSSINQNIKGKPAAPATAEPEPDFFAQFNTGDSGLKDEAPGESLPTSKSEPVQPSVDAGGRDELSEWFAQASEQSTEPFVVGDTPQAASDWGLGDQTPLQAGEPPAQDAQEDLSWLHNLENAARQTDELRAPKPVTDWEQELNTPSQSSDQEDLSWLNNLGALPGTEQAPIQPGQPPQPQEDLSWLDAFKQPQPPSEPAAEPQASSNEDLSWLKELGGAPAESSTVEPSKPPEDLGWLNAFNDAPPSEQPAPGQSSASEDLSWLNTLGGTSSEQAPAPAEKPQEDLGWLNALGAETPSQPSTSASPSGDLDWLNNLGSVPTQESGSPDTAGQLDLGWLSNLQGGESEPLSAAPFAEPGESQGDDVEDLAHVSPFMPRKTAPLQNESDDSMPDWLKSATEEPSMPMGTSALEQIREDYKAPAGPDDVFSWKNFMQDANPAGDQSSLADFFPAQDATESASVDSSLVSSGDASSTPSTEDVNSLFAIDMPDWLTQSEPAKQEGTEQPLGIHAEGGETLAPVDLPSWVQAMRPMDAVIAETASGTDDQPAEREGPLAGFRGLIPVMPVGSARRPKPISLKLQASDEQQASAAILEQLLAGETAPRPLVSTTVHVSQRTLRQVLAVVIWIVLGAMIFMQSQFFPAAALPSGEVVNAMQGIPDRGNVLVVLDYEAALAGEMEAVSAPMLDQLALLRHPQLHFLSTSPNGPALVERLMSNPAVKRTPDGLGSYVAGQDYDNLGFLPGADSGVLTFIESPKAAVPAATVDKFSGYSAVIILTDSAESARIWIEQLQIVRERDAAVALQPLLVASSAQAGPLLQPYVSSRQVNGLIVGLADASRFEAMNNSRPGMARSYLDAFGIGLVLAAGLIVLGSLWSIMAGFRARRAETAEG